MVNKVDQRQSLTTADEEKQQLIVIVINLIESLSKMVKNQF